MSILNKGLSALLSVCFLSSAALADVGIATITDFSGKVLVNQGEGFLPATAEMVLKAGDRVFVGEQSLATLSYEACAVLLDKAAVVTVSAEGGCAVATSVQPVAAKAPLSSPFAGGASTMFFATFAFGATCLAACDAIFGKKNRGVSTP